jgi:hypothetical protein
MPAINPLAQQGSLNKVRGSIVIALNPALNVTAPYMSKGMFSIGFEGNMTEQIETATGVVNSPEPYVMVTIMVDLLRTQSLSYAWLAQAMATTDIGPVVAYTDSSAFPTIPLDNCVMRIIDPGKMDGNDPTVKLTIRGVFYINALLWAAF